MNHNDDESLMREIRNARAAFESLKGKTITVDMSQARFDELMAKRQRDRTDLQLPDIRRRMSFAESTRNIRRRFGRAIKRLGEL